MSEAPLIDISDVSVRLPPGADREYAIQRVNLTVAPNEIVCVQVAKAARASRCWRTQSSGCCRRP